MEGERATLYLQTREWTQPPQHVDLAGRWAWQDMWRLAGSTPHFAGSHDSQPQGPTPCNSTTAYAVSYPQPNYHVFTQQQVRLVGRTRGSSQVLLLTKQCQQD